MFSVDLNCHFFAICCHNALQLLSICVYHTMSYQSVLLTTPPTWVEVRVLLAHGLKSTHPFRSKWNSNPNYQYESGTVTKFPIRVSTSDREVCKWFTCPPRGRPRMTDELQTLLDNRLSACNLSVTSCIVAKNKYVRNGDVKRTNRLYAVTQLRSRAFLLTRWAICLQTFVLSGT